MVAPRPSGLPAGVAGAQSPLLLQRQLVCEQAGAVLLTGSWCLLDSWGEEASVEQKRCRLYCEPELVPWHLGVRAVV